MCIVITIIVGKLITAVQHPALLMIFDLLWRFDG